jgi:hypothetical protein
MKQAGSAVLRKAVSRKELSFAPVAPISNHTESIFSVVFGVFTKMTNIYALKRLNAKGSHLRQLRRGKKS